MRGRVALLASLLLAGCSGPGPRPDEAPGPPPGVWHETQEGETVRTLAHRYRVPVEDVEEINGLEAETALGAGRVVFIPGASVEREVPATAPAASSRPAVQPGGQGRAGLLWPVPGGVVTSRFGPRARRPHEGVDIAAPEGTPVLAVAEGTVIYAGSGVRGYGNLLLLRHAGGLVTVYAHNRKNLVGEKDTVRRGQAIAEVGKTGNASASHLHFEVRRGEIPEDPLRHLQRR